MNGRVNFLSGFKNSRVRLLTSLLFRCFPGGSFLLFGFGPTKNHVNKGNDQVRRQSCCLIRLEGKVPDIRSIDLKRVDN